MSLSFFTFVSFSSMVITYTNANFECHDKQCRCTNGKCSKICSDEHQCNNHQFYCTDQSDSCSVVCFGSNSCKNSTFNVMAPSSSVECVGSGSCQNSLFQCGPSNQTSSINECKLRIDSSLAFNQSQFNCHGNINNCNFEDILGGDGDEDLGIVPLHYDQKWHNNGISHIKHKSQKNKPPPPHQPPPAQKHHINKQKMKQKMRQKSDQKRTSYSGKNGMKVVVTTQNTESFLDDIDDKPATPSRSSQRNDGSETREESADFELMQRDKDYRPSIVKAIR